MDDRRGNLKCCSPKGCKIVGHGWERHLSRGKPNRVIGHGWESHLSRRKSNLWFQTINTQKTAKYRNSRIKPCLRTFTPQGLFLHTTMLALFLSQDLQKLGVSALCISTVSVHIRTRECSLLLQGGWGTTRVSLGQVFTDLFTKVDKGSFFEILPLKEIYNKLK